MKPKPVCLGPEYGAQFRDPAVAAAYRYRAPYPDEAFEFVRGLTESASPWILELGCGSGDFTRGLAPLAARFDALEPADALLEMAKASTRGTHPEITWHHEPAETFRFAGPYSLVVAAQSLHWMDFGIVVPAIANSVVDGGFLVLVDRIGSLPGDLGASIAELAPVFSTNQDFVPYDTVALLKERGLFELEGEHETGMVEFTQDLDDFVEYHHSQNGFSRDRMESRAAAEFDERVRSLASPFLERGRVPMRVGARIIWGFPRSP